MKSQARSLPVEFGRKRLARGTLTPVKTAKSGKSFYCLQYSRGGRHVTRYVPSVQLELWREATENYRAFMEAVERFVDEKSAIAADEIGKEVGRCPKKEGRSRSARPSSRRGA